MVPKRIISQCLHQIQGDTVRMCLYEFVYRGTDPAVLQPGERLSVKILIRFGEVDGK